MWLALLYWVTMRKEKLLWGIPSVGGVPGNGVSLTQEALLQEVFSSLVGKTEWNPFSTRKHLAPWRLVRSFLDREPLESHWGRVWGRCL